ncbi:hypothetical protein LMG28727_06882 [Paraburkholderia kirstenboschensis]|nr:hypothetical protein LMG28727_06882 [Paraburkholderia kirstenboschensis]
MNGRLCGRFRKTYGQPAGDPRARRAAYRTLVLPGYPHEVALSRTRYPKSWRSPGLLAGVTEPSAEPGFFNAMQTYGPLILLVLFDERPGVFVGRGAVRRVQDSGFVKRPVFKDGSSLDVRYDGPCRALLNEWTTPACLCCRGRRIESVNTATSARKGYFQSGGQVAQRTRIRRDPLARRRYRSEKYGLCTPV